MSGDEVWTIGRLLKWTTDYLAKHGSASPRLDAEVLLAHVRKCPRIALYTAFETPCGEAEKTAYRELVKKRAAGEPVAYLVGNKEFFSLNFAVNSHVLIPRPETEHLVSALMDAAKERAAAQPGPTVDPQKSPSEGNATASEGDSAPAVTPLPVSLPVHIVDVGTGSGIIAICAAKFIPGAVLHAVDISAEALEIAKKNAKTLGQQEKITFVRSDLLQALPDALRFDFVVSNPPYISQAEYEKLDPQVRNFEPAAALLGGLTGTEIIESLAAQSEQRLKPGGMLLLEISPMIAGKVEGILAANSAWQLLPTLKDLAGHARVIRAKKS